MTIKESYKYPMGALIKKARIMKISIVRVNQSTGGKVADPSVVGIASKLYNSHREPKQK